MKRERKETSESENGSRKTPLSLPHSHFTPPQ
jgi:hypothetical protein